MTQTVLLTLGRLPKALDIAESLSKAGCRVLIAEPSAWHLCRVSRYVSKTFKTPSPNDDRGAYLAALETIIAEEKVSLVVPVSEEALHASMIASALPEGVSFFSVGHEQLRHLHDKYSFNQLAKSMGLDVPETHLLGTAQAEALAAGKDYILKPTCTCSGQGFSAHQMGEPIVHATGGEPVVVQEKMPGALKSTFSFCHQGRVIGTVVYRAAILSGSVAVAFEKLENEVQIESWIETFVRKSGHTGFIAFDMIEDDSGKPHAIECNPRATSGIHFIEREDLAQAILSPGDAHNLRTRPWTFMHQFWPSLTETQSAVFKKGSALEKLRIMLKAKEVNFSWSDPLPLWLMPMTSWAIMKRAFISGESFGEASTHDIGWFESGGEGLAEEADENQAQAVRPA